MNRTDKVYRYIIEYKRSNDGNSPSVREICDGVDISSTSLCTYHLSKLEREGRIEIHPEKARSIIIIGGIWKLQNE